MTVSCRAFLDCFCLPSLGLFLDHDARIAVNEEPTRDWKPLEKAITLRTESPGLLRLLKKRMLLISFSRVHKAQRRNKSDRHGML
jgi:hypothetical protein